MMPSRPGEADTALVRAGRRGLAAQGDPQRAAGEQRSVSSSMPSYVVTMGELRQDARPDLDWVRAHVAEREERMSGLSRREALGHL